jgi:hypothetical protein
MVRAGLLGAGFLRDRLEEAMRKVADAAVPVNTFKPTMLWRA